MENRITFHTSGTCSKTIELAGKDGHLTEVRFEGGCNGNLQGISRLVVGLPYADVINKLRGIQCGLKGTSCPDQLSYAVEELWKRETASR